MDQPFSRDIACLAHHTVAKAQGCCRPSWEHTPCHTGKELHLTQVLPVGPLVALHVEQRVAMVKNFGPWRTQGVVCCLTMPGHKEAMVHRWSTRGTHGSWQPIRAWWARKPSRTCRTKTNKCLNYHPTPPQNPQNPIPRNCSLSALLKGSRSVWPLTVQNKH